MYSGGVSSIASESTKACTVKNLEVSVVSKKIGNYREVLWVSRTLMVGWRGSFFFCLGQWESRVMIA